MSENSVLAFEVKVLVGDGMREIIIIPVNVTLVNSVFVVLGNFLALSTTCP